MVAKLKVDQLETVDGTGIITANNPLAGDGASLTGLNATNLGSGTVPTARLGTGTADADNFLRGDGAWAEAGGGKVLQVVSHTWSEPTSVSSTSYGSVGYSAASITPSATTSKILILVNFQAFIRYDAEGHQYASFKITKDTNTTVKEFGCAIREHHLVFGTANTAKLWGGSFAIVFLDSPSSTSSLEYALAMKCLQTSPNGIVIVNEHNYLGENPASTITLMEIGA
jgi:hypothetical protein